MFQYTVVYSSTVLLVPIIQNHSFLRFSSTCGTFRPHINGTTIIVEYKCISTLRPLSSEDHIPGLQRVVLKYRDDCSGCICACECMNDSVFLFHQLSF